MSVVRTDRNGRRHHVHIDKNGKTDVNGNYAKVTLKKGGFEVNLTTINAAGNAVQPKITTTTCTAYASVSAPITLFNGTGLYAGITGTVKLNETYAIIMPKYASGAKLGQCNMSDNAQPVAQYVAIMGSGTVSFGQ